MEIAYTLYGTPESMPPTDVPGDYKQWLLTQGNIDPYLRKALGS
jgi:exodeoxyribonuclease X